MNMIFCLILNVLFASQFVEISVEGSSSLSDPAQARQEILNQAIEKISLENIEAIIGSAEMQSKMSLIKQKVLPNYGRYIPYLRQGDLNRRGPPFNMSLNMHFSREALRALLLQEGVLSFSTENVKALPFISFLDRKYSKSYKWWFVDNNYQSTLVFDIAQNFQSNLRESLWSDSFYVLNPVSGDLHRFIPDNIRSVSYSTNDLRNLGTSLNSQLVINGHFHYGPNPKNSLAVLFELELEAIVVASGRKVASLKRNFESPVGDYDEIVKKYSEDFFKEAISDFRASLMESWQRGVFDTERIRIVIQGDFNYKDYSDLKRSIAQKSLRLKNMADRSFNPREFVIEADVAQGVEGMLKDLEGFSWKGRSLQLRRTGPKEIRISL